MFYLKNAMVFWIFFFSKIHLKFTKYEKTRVFLWFSVLCLKPEKKITQSENFLLGKNRKISNQKLKIFVKESKISDSKLKIFGRNFSSKSQKFQTQIPKAFGQKIQKYLKFEQIFLKSLSSKFLNIVYSMLISTNLCNTLPSILTFEKKIFQKKLFKYLLFQSFVMQHRKCTEMQEKL